MAASPLPLQLKYNRGVNQAFRVVFVGCLLKPLRFCILSEVLVSVLHAVSLQKLSSNPEVLLPSWQLNLWYLLPLWNLCPSSFLGEKFEDWERTSKNQTFLKLIKLLLYDLLIVWCLCVIYEHLASHFHKKDNIVEADMQLVMWYCKEGGRGRWELLHRVRQLLGSEMQGRKDKSFEEMERKQDEICQFCFTRSRKRPHCAPGEYLALSFL